VGLGGMNQNNLPCIVFSLIVTKEIKGRRGHDRMVVEFPTTCAMSAQYH
jgi:hypothetical protein